MEIKTIANFLNSCIEKKALLSGKIIHAYIIRNGQNRDAFLCNRLLVLYSKCGQTVSARHMFDKNNFYSWYPMLECYYNDGHFQEALQLFKEMPERDIMSFNMMISALVRGGYGKKALGVFDKMCLEGFVPNNYMLASVLSACRILGDVVCGSKCHGICVKIGLEKNIFVGNALLSMYAKNKCLEDGIQVFEGLVEPNEVSFTAMMGALADSDRVVYALSTFRSMCRIGIWVDSVSLSSVLGFCAIVEGKNFGKLSGNIYGRQIHGLTVKLGFERDLHLSNSLLDMYVKSGDMERAELAFSDIPRANIVSWNIMIGGYGQKKQVHKALEYMERMLHEGYEPDEVTYFNMLTACGKSGDIEISRSIFDIIPCPSVSSWNAIISGYMLIENHKEAIKLFRKMQLRSLRPGRITFAKILSSCAALGFLQGGKQVHAASYRNMLDSDVYIASGLIGMYSNCNNVKIANRIFDKIPEKDIVCWNALMAGLSVNSLEKEALNLFKEMLMQSTYPTQFSYTTALSCCAKLSSLSQGKQVHAQISKHDFKSDVFLRSSLIDMYCKCGDVDMARKIFNTMLVKSTVAWNVMIHGYAQNGRGNEGLNLYECMIATGEKPDEFTFVSVLTACSHSGLLDTGIKIFDSMELDYGIKPLINHYTCIIDALGRANRFDEIEMILDKMPYRDSPIVWEVLLSSCRVHGNVNLARKAADRLIYLDPKNSAPYVLLANMFSSDGRWEEVKAIREMMSGKNVVKNRGYSWIENDDGLVKLGGDEIKSRFRRLLENPDSKRYCQVDAYARENQGLV